MHHVHESPPVMLVPLFILAAGALFAGIIFHGALHRRGLCRVLEGVAVHAAGQPHPARDPRHCRCGSSCAPFIAMLIGFARRLAVLHPLAGDCRRSVAAQPSLALRLPAQQVVFRRALRLPVRAAGQGARPFPVEDAATAPSSTVLARTAFRRASSTSPTASSSCRPATSTTTPSPC